MESWHYQYNDNHTFCGGNILPSLVQSTVIVAIEQENKLKKLTSIASKYIVRDSTIPKNLKDMNWMRLELEVEEMREWQSKRRYLKTRYVKKVAASDRLAMPATPDDSLSTCGN